MNLFDSKLCEHKLQLTRKNPTVLQLNVGRLCNLTCIHCHVSAGPTRKEIMTRDTLDRILTWFEQSDIETLDLTGGAPEMMPDFQYLLERVRAFDRPRRIIDRCNLTILVEPGYEWLAPALAHNGVEIVASMPCYEPANVEAQRGQGVFDKSIQALQLLNKIGYGDSRTLDLVYNPNGAFLPPDQSELEAEYKREMDKHFGIRFNKLYTITNLPIARFSKYLKRKGEFEDYMKLLLDAFNPDTVDSLMCRDTLNVSWTGELFDCDFNQMAGLNVKHNNGSNLMLWDVDPDTLQSTHIRTANHCLGCTAGNGSSCGGALSERIA